METTLPTAASGNGPLTTEQGDTSMTLIEKTVIKRNGLTQKISEDKIKVRLERLLEGLATEHIDLSLIINKTVSYA